MPGEEDGGGVKKTYVANLLMGKLAVILQDVVVLGARGDGDFLRDGLVVIGLLVGSAHSPLTVQ